MTSPPSDRRRRRSNDPLIALHYQLSSTRQDGRLEAVVVADDSGLVVAGAGAWAACEEIAAYAPLLVRGRENPSTEGRSPSRVAEMRQKVAVQPVEVDGQRVLLCASGGVGRGEALDRAACAVARILRQAA